MIFPPSPFSSTVPSVHATTVVSPSIVASESSGANHVDSVPPNRTILPNTLAARIPTIIEERHVRWSDQEKTGKLAVPFTFPFNQAQSRTRRAQTRNQTYKAIVLEPFNSIHPCVAFAWGTDKEAHRIHTMAIYPSLSVISGIFSECRVIGKYLSRLDAEFKAATKFAEEEFHAIRMTGKRFVEIFNQKIYFYSNPSAERELMESLCKMPDNGFSKYLDTFGSTDDILRHAKAYKCTYDQAKVDWHASDTCLDGEKIAKDYQTLHTGEIESQPSIPKAVSDEAMLKQPQSDPSAPAPAVIDEAKRVPVSNRSTSSLWAKGNKKSYIGSTSKSYHIPAKSSRGGGAKSRKGLSKSRN